MQYITQLALATLALAKPQRASRRENNFTFYPMLLKSDESGGSGWIRTIDPRLIKTVL
jgi:hypothetical protein